MGDVIPFPRQRPEPVKMPLYSPIHHATAHQEWSDGWWAASWGSEHAPT